GGNGPDVTIRLAAVRSPFYDNLYVAGFQVGMAPPFYVLGDPTSVAPADWLIVESRGGRGGAGLPGANGTAGAAGPPGGPPHPGRAPSWSRPRPGTFSAYRCRPGWAGWSSGCSENPRQAQAVRRKPQARLLRLTAYGYRTTRCEYCRKLSTTSSNSSPGMTAGSVVVHGLR